MFKPAAALFLLALAPAAQAAMMAPSAPVGVRGTITAVSGAPATGTKIEVAGKGGAKYTVALAPTTSVATASTIAIDAIKPDSFIGTAAEPGKDGLLVANEVHVFPESMRGTGEGHRPWDTSPTSSMTNGNVGAVKIGEFSGAKGRTLTVDYKGGQQKVFVPASVPIVAFAPGTMANVVKGAAVFLFAKKLPDGTLATDRLVVGINGTVPPM